MINLDAIYRRYKAFRRKGYNAENAARAAIRPQKKHSVDWQDGTASIEIGAYDIEVRQEQDHDPDLSWLGEYANKPDTDAIVRANVSKREYRYWNPTVSLAEHFQGWQRIGYAKATAWLKALECREQDYNRMESFCRGDWAMLGIIATARLGDMVCGEAALYGIESDSGDYLDETALMLAKEAAHAADSNRNTLIRIRAEEIAALAAAPRQTV